VRVLDVPGFNIVFEDTFRNVGSMALDTRHDRLYMWGNRYRRFTFWVYDYSARTLEQVPMRHSPSDTFQVDKVVPAKDGDRLFFMGGGGGISNTWVGCWSLEQDAMLWKRPMLTGNGGGLALSPDETELWVTDPGLADIAPNPGTIFILEANSGAYLGGISLAGYYPPPTPSWVPLTGAWILFSPTGEKVYVGTGLRLNALSGSALVVDRRSRTITKLFMPNLDGAPGRAVICPKR
jgi:hypothetical protein